MTDRSNEIFDSQRKEVVATALTFEVPSIDVPLPSSGKTYAEEHPLHKQKSIEITAMTAHQENILTNRSLAKRGTLLTSLIQSCLKNKNIDAREMLNGDRNTIMVALRSSGYGPDYKVKVSCPECETVSTQTFELDKLPIKRLEIDPIRMGSNVFEFSLPKSKSVVRFKFLTGADEEEIAVEQSNKKKIGLGSENELVTSGLRQMIVSINGITDKSQISAALPRMPAFDSNALRKFIQDNEPGMQLKGPMLCQNCDFKGEVGMPLGAGFFWPGAE